MDKQEMRYLLNRIMADMESLAAMMDGETEEETPEENPRETKAKMGVRKIMAGEE